MLGPESVGQQLEQLLAAAVPARVVVLDAELGPIVPGELDGEDLVTPRLVTSTMIPARDVAIGDWPFLVVVVQRASRFVRADVDDGALLFDVDYPAHVFVWARGDGWHHTARVRERLTLAVREVLLGRQQLTPDIRLTESTYREAYSEVGTDPELGATVAATRIEATFTARERLTPPAPLGSVATISVDTPHLGWTAAPHPALG